MTSVQVVEVMRSNVISDMDENKSINNKIFDRYDEEKIHEPVVRKSKR